MYQVDTQAQACCELVYRRMGSDTNGYMRVVLNDVQARWWQGREERLEIGTVQQVAFG
jgi:hypothetical protein